MRQLSTDLVAFVPFVASAVVRSDEPNDGHAAKHADAGSPVSRELKVAHGCRVLKTAHLVESIFPTGLIGQREQVSTIYNVMIS